MEIDKGSDIWNVAQGYTTLKILKPLVELDKLIKIAIYGVENIEEINQIPPQMKTDTRIEAINRVIDTLKEIFENSEFAMKKYKTEEELKKLIERVERVEKVLPAITIKTTDQRTNSEIDQINEKHFKNCLNELRLIKKEIPKPLNKNGLIFSQSEEIDLDMIKREIIEEG